MRPLCAWIGLLLLTGSGGCCAVPCFGSACPPDVYVLRGIAGYWPGVCGFEQALESRGIRPKVAFAESYPFLADEIACDREVGGACRPLVIVGYSTGGNGAIEVCRRLEQRGIAVDKLVLLDTSYEDAIPGNVRNCFNLYKSRPFTDWIPIFRGVPMPAPCASTRIVNFDVNCEAPELSGWWDNHLVICANPCLHELMAAEVLEGLEGGSGCGGQSTCSRDCP